MRNCVFVTQTGGNDRHLTHLTLSTHSPSPLITAPLMSDYLSHNHCTKWNKMKALSFRSRGTNDLQQMKKTHFIFSPRFTGNHSPITGQAITESKIAIPFEVRHFRTIC
jgi:hypothetical protein